MLPAWAADGPSGEALTDTGAMLRTVDVSPDDRGPGILMAS